jgi:hypothetical protein
VRSWIQIAVLGALVGAATAHAQLPLVWLRGTDVRGRVFDIERLRGQVVVVTFASRRTARESHAIHDRLAPLVAPGDVAVVMVINLDGVPGFLMGYARRRIEEAAARSRLVHLVDERGRLTRAFSAEGTEILVIDRGGRLCGRFRGESELERAVQTVEGARSGRAD